MVDTEGSEVHTNELEQPIKAEVLASRTLRTPLNSQPSARTPYPRLGCFTPQSGIDENIYHAGWV